MKPVLKKVGHWQLLLVLLVALAMCMGMGGARANDPAPLLNTNLLFDSPLPPANDDLLNATVVTTLPYSDVVDNTWATGEPDEPWCCGDYYEPLRTVWYIYTPTERVLLRTGMDGSGVYYTVLTVYEAYGSADGFGDFGYMTCVSYGGVSQFWTEVGKTYYFQATDIESGGGSLKFNLEQVLPPPNDNFANATGIYGLPFQSGDVNMAAATVETGEPRSTCASYYDPMPATIWYAFTTESPATLTSYATGSTPFEAVYEGSSLSDLDELACDQWGNPMSFVAEAGTTYYFQVGSLYDTPGWVSFSLDLAPPPNVDFGYWPGDPSPYETVNFNSWCWDPAEMGIVEELWDLGDGTVEEGCCPSHQYTADGDYTASLTCTTPDGRSGTSVKTIPVRTHDVAITRLVVPKSAKAGQTRQISVEVKNKQYEESVQVELLRSTAWGFEYIVTSNAILE